MASAESDADLAEHVAGAAAGCWGVAGVGTPSGAIATYLPGKRVNGVVIDDDRVTISVVARWGSPFDRVADGVRHAVAPLVGPRPVDVSFVDIEADPGQIQFHESAPPRLVTEGA